MSEFSPNRYRASRASYFQALAATAAAIALRVLLDPFLGAQFPYSSVFLAVLFTARYGGFGPSVLTAIVGGIFATYLFVPPRYQFDPVTPESVTAISVFALIITVTIYFGRAMHRLRDQAVAAAEEAERGKERLEEEVLVRRKAEDALKEADRRKDEFLAMLAHELRNPLAPIRYGLAMLNSPQVSAEQSEQARAMMGRQIDHIVRLVDDLLDISRILRRRIELRRSPMDLREAVHRAVEMSRPAIDSGEHQLTVSLTASPVMIDGDMVRLTQVIANVLNNAAKYTPLGGQIGISLETEGLQARIRIRDTGTGIAVDLMPRIFDLFIQGDRSSARTQGGLGIGLTLVKQLVEMHGGSVAVESPGVGGGSVFSIQLPMLEAPAPVRRLPRDVRGDRGPTIGNSAGSLRVLVVDDNTDAAESLASVLRQSGHQVKTAYSGLAALAEAPTFQPDAVMLDIGLPGMDGHEVARQLRTQPNFAETCFIAITGYGQETDRKRSVDSGFDRHLVKPVNPDEIFQLLESLVPARSR